MNPKKKKKYSKDSINSALGSDEMALNYLPPIHPQASILTTQAIQSGADPQALDTAKQYLGSQDYIGLCEKFVEQVTKGATGLFSSALDAWNKAQNKVQGLAGIQPGDAIYFGPDQSNGGYGHTGVYTGGGNMISATSSGVKQTDLKGWIASTGQHILGYVKK